MLEKYTSVELCAIWCVAELSWLLCNCYVSCYLYCRCTILLMVLSIWTFLLIFLLN